MFEGFTQSARQVMSTAQEEARALKHAHVGTEHILLGLLSEPDGVASRTLPGVSFADVRLRTARSGGEEEAVPGQLPFTPQATMALAQGTKAAALAGGSITGGHILLGLLSYHASGAARILQALGVDLEPARGEIIGENPVGRC